MLRHYASHHIFGTNYFRLIGEYVRVPGQVVIAITFLSDGIGRRQANLLYMSEKLIVFKLTTN